MTAAEKRTFTLPREQADYIDRLVASGAYADGDEVIRAGLHALEERDEVVEHDEVIERWLREEVAPVVDAARADPSSLLTEEEVFEAVYRHHDERVKRDREV